MRPSDAPHPLPVRGRQFHEDLARCGGSDDITAVTGVPTGHLAAIVCLHALGGNALHWAAVEPALRRLAPTYTPELLALATAGRGSLEAVRKGLASLLESAGPAAVIGSSFGGGVGLLQASLEPATVARLVLSGSMLPPPDVRRRSATRRVLARRFRQRAGDAESLVRAWRAGTFQEMSRAEWLLRGNAERPDALDRSLVSDIVSAPGLTRSALVALAAGAVSSLALMTNAARFWAIVDGVTCPVLVIHGGSDRTVPARDLSALRERRPDWEIVVFNGVGHLPHLEAPDRWSDVVSQWLLADGP
jgi:pimeloyl-ACP methyl ester carboxylesterase